MESCHKGKVRVHAHISRASSANKGAAGELAMHLQSQECNRMGQRMGDEPAAGEEVLSSVRAGALGRARMSQARAP